MRGTSLLGELRGWLCQQGRMWRRGQSLVEFALAAPVFFLLLGGIVDGAWYVLEVSAVSNSATQAVRWEIASQNWCTDQATCTQLDQPYCDQPTSDNVPSGMLQAAQAGAGPFAGAVGGGISNSAVLDSSGTLVSCKVTVTAPFSPLAALVHIGPSNVSSTITEDIISG